ncbi:MAG: metalloregulator ArsR/SmtB family transcription factor [Acidimicrobiia bacterium]|nr:metalloregulator ArsR/SmtB family transcription factor [Acidimicrobiia bacterium]
MSVDEVHPPPPEGQYDDASLAEAALLLSALGDAERLRILDLMRDGEVCVTQLAEVTGAAVSTVSQRLRVLRERNLVNARRQGKHIYYSLADEHVINLVQVGLAHALEVGGERRRT